MTGKGKNFSNHSPEDLTGLFKKKPNNVESHRQSRKLNTMETSKISTRSTTTLAPSVATRTPCTLSSKHKKRRSFWTRQQQERHDDEDCSISLPVSSYPHHSIGTMDETKQSDDEGPSDEDSRPSSLFGHRNSRKSTTGSRRIPALRFTASGTGTSIQEKRQTDPKIGKNDFILLQSMSKAKEPESSSVDRQLTREQRRKELIAQYIQIQEASKSFGKGEEKVESRTRNVQTQSVNPYHIDNIGDDDDDGIVEQKDEEADGVARRRYCFPSFVRPRFFGDNACTTAPIRTASKDTGQEEEGDDDDEEAYDYDYYFTIAENSEKRHSRNKDRRQPTTASSSHCQLPIQYHVKGCCHSSNSSHSSDASPQGIDPTKCKMDLPDTYCFFPVDEASNSNDDQEDQQTQDLPLCNWTDVEYYSSACASQLVAPEMAQQLHTTCHENAQQFQTKYYHVTQVAVTNCSAMDPREALEDLVPQDFLSRFINSCHIQGHTAGNNNKNNDNTNGTGKEPPQNEFQY